MHCPTKMALFSVLAHCVMVEKILDFDLEALTANVKTVVLDLLLTTEYVLIVRKKHVTT